MCATIRRAPVTRQGVRGTFRNMAKRKQFVITPPMRQTRAMDEAAALAKLGALEIETPSWGYGNSGTRFHVYPWPGAARTVWERLDDAALVHRLTGSCPSVALHIPWDRVDDWPALARHAAERGIRIGAI